MKRVQKLLIFALGTLTTSGGPQSTLRAETEAEPVTLEVGERGLCHVHYLHADREAPCTEIVALMRSELRVPAQEHVVLRASKGAPYEEVSRLLQALREAGYKLKMGYILTQ